MDLRAQLGRRITELREQRGLSQYQLATAVGVSSQFISRVEGGTRAPSFRVLEALASKLSVKPDELFRGGTEAVGKKTESDSFDVVQLHGAARRLAPDDLRLVLDLTRRLGRK